MLFCCRRGVTPMRGRADEAKTTRYEREKGNGRWGGGGGEGGGVPRKDKSPTGKRVTPVLSLQPGDHVLDTTWRLESNHALLPRWCLKMWTIIVHFLESAR